MHMYTYNIIKTHLNTRPGVREARIELDKNITQQQNIKGIRQPKHIRIFSQQIHPQKRHDIRDTQKVVQRIESH